MVWAVKWSRVLQIRRRSRIYKKHDLDTDEIWSEHARDESGRVCRSYSYIEGHDHRFYKALGLTMSEISVLSWLRENVSWYPSCVIVDDCFEMSDVKREVDGRTWVRCCSRSAFVTHSKLMTLSCTSVSRMRALYSLSDCSMALKKTCYYRLNCIAVMYISWATCNYNILAAILDFWLQVSSGSVTDSTIERFDPKT